MADKLEKKIIEGKMYPLTIRMHQSPVNFIKFNKDGTMFFTCANDGKVGLDLPRLIFTVPRQASC